MFRKEVLEMAWVEAVGEFEGHEVRIYVELWSSRRNVYKTVRYELDGQRVTRRKKEIKKLVEGAPDILFANTYFWNPFWGDARQREYHAKKLLEDVAEFFREKGLKVKTSWEEE